MIFTQMSEEMKNELLEVAARATVKELMSSLGVEALKTCLSADIPEGREGNLVVSGTEATNSNYTLAVRQDEVDIQYGSFGPYRILIKTVLGWIDEPEQ